MIKNVFLSTIVILFAQFSLAQVLQVEYKMQTNFSIPYESNYNLFVDGSRSLFIEKSGEKQLLSKKENTVEGLVYMKDVERSLPDAEYIYRNRGNTSFIFMENWFDNLLTVKDSVAMDWEIFDEAKRIDNYMCQKAMGNFRGRVYEAWFSTEYNYPFGPYKFYGLPGIIIQISSLDSKVNFTATRILTVSDSSILNKYQDISGNSEPLNLNSYLDQVDVLVDKDLRKSWARMTSRESNPKPYSKCEDCSESGIEIYN